MAEPPFVYDYDAIQKIAVTTSSTASSAIDAKRVLLRSTVDCCIDVGDAPVATASKLPLANSDRLHIRLKPGQKVAVIRDSGTDGSLWIIPVVG